MHVLLKKFARLIVLVSGLMGLAACSFFGYATWKEEVQLNDGRVIVVEQQKRAGHGIAREAWLTINLPEFSARPIVWHEHLSPLVVNVDGGKLYVVGYPPTVAEFNEYGHPHPAYVGFVWKQGVWNRIAFEEIPEKIYITNMLIEGFPPKGTIFLTLEKKNSYEVNGRAGRVDYLQRINPKFIF
jgi:hypothetical protein